MFFVIISTHEITNEVDPIDKYILEILNYIKSDHSQVAVNNLREWHVKFYFSSEYNEVRSAIRNDSQMLEMDEKVNDLLTKSTKDSHDYDFITSQIITLLLKEGSIKLK